MDSASTAALTAARSTRIAVLGCGGSGKTYLSTAISRHGDMPLTHLDALFYAPDWTAVSPDSFARAQKRVVAGDRWVIDGNYVSTLSIRMTRADAVVILDLHPLVCLWGVISRRIRNRPGQNPDTGVYNRVTWNFVKYVLTYRSKILPRVYEELDKAPSPLPVLVFKRRRDVRKLARAFMRGGTGGSSGVRPQ